MADTTHQVHEQAQDWPARLAATLNDPRCALSVKDRQVGSDGKLTNGPKQGVYIQNAPFKTSGIGMPQPKSKLQDFGSQPYYDGNSRMDLSAGAETQMAWATARASRESFCGFNGVCNGFVAIAVAIIVAKDGPVPAGTRVEQFSLGGPGVQHTFAVVDRAATATDDDLATWGPTCHLVDHWWALQEYGHLGDAPSVFPVSGDGLVFTAWKTAISKYVGKPKRVAGWNAGSAKKAIVWGTKAYDAIAWEKYS